MQLQSTLITPRTINLPHTGGKFGATTFDRELRTQHKPRSLKQPIRQPIKGPRDL